MGLTDGLGRADSMFGVTVRNLDNAKLVPITNWTLPFGTNQALLYYGVGSKGATVIKDLYQVDTKK